MNQKRINYSDGNHFLYVDQSLWSNSLLDKQAYFILSSAIPLYTIAQCLMLSLIALSLDNEKYCIGNSSLAPTTHKINFGTAFGFGLSCFCQLIRIITVQNEAIEKKMSLLKLYCSLLIINLIACTSHTLSYTLSQGIICQDSLGVYTQITQYAEWLLTVPFLFYLAFAVEQKAEFEIQHYIVLTSLALMIGFGYLMVIVRDPVWCIFLLGCSCLSFLSATVTPFISHRQLLRTGYKFSFNYSEDRIDIKTNAADQLLKYIRDKRTFHKMERTKVLVVILAYFPTVYLMGMAGLLNRDWVISANMIGSIVGKLVYSSFIIDSHVNLQDDLVLAASSHKTKYIQQLAEEHSNEFRHMIGNVAHDLKTPLSGFINGLDFIGSIVKETIERTSLHDCNGRSSIQQEDAHLILNALRSVLATYANVKNINSFMLMTINRCIDYTKASKGIKLMPKYETVDLNEALNLPLNCMKDLQTRIKLKVKDIPSEISRFIITDKQWLQENILCLLSNAVKYSSDGEVTIEVKLINGTSSIQMGRYPSQSNSFINNNTDQEGERTLNGQQKSTAGLGSSYQNGETAQQSSDMALLLPKTDHSDIDRDSSSSPSEKKCQSMDSSIATTETELMLFEIEDTGIGISPEAARNLFNPFEQAQRFAGGTGLGLYSLAKRLDALKGLYGVMPRKDGGVGSLFWFAIPYRPDLSASWGYDALLKSSEDRLSPWSVSAGLKLKPLRVNSTGRSYSNSPKAMMKEKSNSPLKGESVEALSILIVDDSISILKMSTLMLKRHGHTVQQAENGVEALTAFTNSKKLDGKRFDVILMDLQMPVMDGLEAVGRIRMLERNDSMEDKSTTTGQRDYQTFQEVDSKASSHLHQMIIGVSANSDHETMQEAFRAGVDGFLAKPYQIAALHEKYWALRNSFRATSTG